MASTKRKTRAAAKRPKPVVKAKSKPATKPAAKVAAKKPARGAAKAEAKKTALRLLQREGDPTGATLEAVRHYVESGVDVNELIDVNPSQDAFMETLLHLAAAHQHVEIMKYLLGRGADANLANGKAGERPLHMVIGASDADVKAVALLLEHGADVNATMTNQDSTPLHDAIIMGHVAIVELLLARGADPTKQTRWSGTGSTSDAFEVNEHYLARGGDGAAVQREIQRLLAGHRGS